MKSIKIILSNEEGSILLVALFMLFAVTMLGIFSNNSSVIETQVSANNAFYKKSFYAAEAGLEYAQIILQRRLLESPENKKLGPGVFPKWTFALEGWDPDKNWDLDIAIPLSKDVLVDMSQNPGKYPALLRNETIGDCTYTVFVYDDWEAGEGNAQIANKDDNSLIYVRSIGTGPRGAQAIVEMILEGEVDEKEISDYILQSGAGAGKASEGGDRNAIEDFTTQAANVGT